MAAGGHARRPGPVVTPAKLEELNGRVREVLDEYFERLVRPELRPPGARQVSWLNIAFRTTSGPGGPDMIPRLLRDRVFRRYWCASTISMFGDQISGVALPLAAVLPPPSLPSALHALTLAQLLVVTFGAGILSTGFTVSDGTLFVSIVPEDRYVDGQSLIYGSRALSFVGGPSVGGVLVQVLSAPFAIAADALSFLGSAFFLSRIQRGPRAGGRRGRRAGAGRGSVHRPFGTGPRVAGVGGHDQLLQKR